jgi:hypothetical protein
MRIRARLPRTLVLAASLATSLGACTQWSRRPIPAPGQDRFFPGPMRVTRTEGLPILLDNVTIGADSVVGWEVTAPRDRVAIPVSDALQVEARRANVPASVAVTLLSITAALAVWGFVILNPYGGAS